MNKTIIGNMANYHRFSFIAKTARCILYLAVFMGAALITSTVTTKTSHASPVVGFNAGRIIDDSVFSNSASMNTTQIQAFLNSKVLSCDTNGSQPASEFGRPDLTHAQYAALVITDSNGNITKKAWSPPPYTCLKDYTENGLTTAQIIYNVAQKYRINPQVLIVLLQKEQGLTTDTWPLATQYKTATGYGCPDTTVCDSQYFGLTNQLNWSGTMFRAILDNNPNWYTPYILGNNYIKWHPDYWNSSTSSWQDVCGGTTVNIQNRATQALYNYTPYQPNTASLAAGYGTGDSCSSYGNRNFYLYFSDWFGSTQSGLYSWGLSSFNVYTDSGHTGKINDGSILNLTPGQTVYARVVARNNGNTVWAKNTILLGTFDTSPVLRDSSWISRDRASTMNEDSASYDQLATFDYKITAPLQLGTYLQNYNLVIDGVTWFNNSGPNIRVNVSNPDVDPPMSSGNKLSSDSSLPNRTILLSPNRKAALRLDSGQLSLFVNMRYVWGVNPSDKSGTHLVNQPDGNLVLYNDNGTSLWSTNTSGKGVSSLELQNDGNLVLYSQTGATWSTDTNLLNQNLRVNNLLSPGQTLFKGQHLNTPDKHMYFVLQDDGNLVLYSPNRAIWASRTVGSDSAYLTMQDDGNLVLYSNSGQAIWSSRTPGRGASNIELQMDANIVIYSSTGPTWTTSTAGLTN